ncbi:hypothetical protein [Chromobacterium haemolyticum]|uniref:hypothetical protein n=1 Tax=Chromobacterium haemolyticum TaxID=394935 RepID=UPI0009DA3593|nr:hypothetical protein [Chromobacterium haemolyticum]OQS33256.1 hypothetical protein B0T39_21230 [Chromobacterium haemolyticum]
MTHQTRRYRALLSPSLPLNTLLSELRPFNSVAPASLKRLENRLYAREQSLRSAIRDLRKGHESLCAVLALLEQAKEQPCPCNVLHLTLEPAQQWLQHGLDALQAQP